MVTEVVGWMAAAYGSIVFAPQVVKLLVARSTAGVSLRAWQIMLGSSIAWCGHGVMLGHPNVVVPNLLLALSALLILVALRRERAISWVGLLGPGLLLGSANLAVEVAWGPLAFAVVVFLPSALSQLAQLRELITSPSVSGVSGAYLILNTVNQVAWLGWSLLAAEASVTIVASALGVLMALNCGALLVRRRSPRVRRVGAGQVAPAASASLRAA